MEFYGQKPSCLKVVLSFDFDFDSDLDSWWLVGLGLGLVIVTCHLVSLDSTVSVRDRTAH